MLFGLSMDYHVFIISRIREAVLGGASTADAVAGGIKSTAGVVTSAALVMIAVFSIFATLGAIEFKQMGVGLAAAILIDATIVRAVLLPATMKLLGEWNWWLPRGLAWLPRAGRPARAAGPLVGVGQHQRSGSCAPGADVARGAIAAATPRAGRPWDNSPCRRPAADRPRVYRARCVAVGRDRAPRAAVARAPGDRSSRWR